MKRIMKEPPAARGETAKSYGNKLGYAIFYFLLQYMGLKWAYGLLFLIVPYYVLFKPGIYQRAKPYLQKRFPEDHFFKRYLRLFKYIFIFGQILIDQFYFGLVGESQIELHFEREDEILALLNQKPVIFLMSHVGFWEIAMAGSSRFDKTLNVLVNRDFDQNKRKRFYDLQKQRFKLINVAEQYGGMIEATNALLNGEVVGVAGDRAEHWRSKIIPFLGFPAKFPTIAPQLAVATDAAVIALFSSKEKPFVIRLHWKDISAGVLAQEGLSREDKIQKMLELYRDELEKHLQDHPYLWFNFFDFWRM